MEFKRQLHRTKKNIKNKGVKKMINLLTFKQGSKHQPKNLLTKLKKKGAKQK